MRLQRKYSRNIPYVIQQSINVFLVFKQIRIYNKKKFHLKSQDKFYSVIKSQKKHFKKLESDVRDFL